MLILSNALPNYASMQISRYLMRMALLHCRAGSHVILVVSQITSFRFQILRVSSGTLMWPDALYRHVAVHEYMFSPGSYCMR